MTDLQARLLDSAIDAIDPAIEREAAAEIARLTSEVEQVRSEMGCAYREVARFEIALGEQETKADALAEAAIRAKKNLEGANTWDKIIPKVVRRFLNQIIEDLQAALTDYQEPTQ